MFKKIFWFIAFFTCYTILSCSKISSATIEIKYSQEWNKCFLDQNITTVGSINTNEWIAGIDKDGNNYFEGKLFNFSTSCSVVASNRKEVKKMEVVTKGLLTNNANYIVDVKRNESERSDGQGEYLWIRVYGFEKKPKDLNFQYNTEKNSLWIKKHSILESSNFSIGKSKPCDITQEVISLSNPSNKNKPILKLKFCEAKEDNIKIGNKIEPNEIIENIIKPVRIGNTSLDNRDKLKTSTLSKEHNKTIASLHKENKLDITKQSSNSIVNEVDNEKIAKSTNLNENGTNLSIEKNEQIDRKEETQLSNSNESIVKYDPEKENELLSFLSKTEKNLGVICYDINNHAIFTFNWVYPYSEIDLKEIYDEYKVVELKTTFGDFALEKKSLKESRIVRISDFFVPVNISLNEGDVSIYSTNDGSSWMLHEIRSISDKERKPIFFIPKINRNGKIIFKISALNSNLEYYEKYLDYKSISPTNIQSVEIIFQPKSKHIIKSIPNDCIIYIECDDEILLKGRTDAIGNFEIPQSLRPFNNKSIVVEKEGYISKKVPITDIKNVIQEIELSPTGLINLRVIKKNSDIFKKTGENSDDLNIVINNQANETIFNGKLSNLNYFPKSSFSYELRHVNYIFAKKSINLLEPSIDIIPLEKKQNIKIQLVSESSNIFNEQTLVEQNVNFTKENNEIIVYNLDGDSFLLQHIPFSMEFIDDKIKFKPFVLNICKPGYLSKKVRIDPSNSKNNIVELKEKLIPKTPEISILLSANKEATGDFFEVAINALLETIDFKRVNLFIAAQGKIKKVLNKDDLINYSPANHLDYNINEEIELGNATLKSNYDLCVPSYLIYLAKISSPDRKIELLKNLHVISPDPKRAGWDGQWHQAADSKEIGILLKKFMNGEM